MLETRQTQASAISPNADSDRSLQEYLRLLGSLFTARDKRRYALLFGMMVVGAVLEFVGIGLIPAFIALLTSPDRVSQTQFVGDLIEGSNAASRSLIVWVGAGALIGVFILKTVYSVWMYHVQFRLIARHRTNIAKRLLSCYMHASWAFHLQQNSSELMRKVMAETSEMIAGVLVPLLSVVLGGMMTILLLILMMLVLPWQCVVTFVILGAVCGYLMSWYRRHLTEAGNKAKLRARKALKTVNEGLDTLMDARILGREQFLVDRFEDDMGAFADADRTRLQASASFPHILEAVVAIGVVLVLLLLVGTGRSMNEIIPELALIAATAMRLRQTTSRVFAGMGQIHFSKVVIGNIVDQIRTLEPQQQGSGAAMSAEQSLMFNEKIQFENVSFRYPTAGRQAISDISLVIEKGKSVAFVGPTGSGKSTAVNLLLGLLDPTKGTIISDGHAIHENTRSWQNCIGYVPQTISLLDDTIRCNIAFGVSDDEVDEGRIHEVIRLAQLEETIADLENGLDTVVGEKGVRISGGQRQRLGIARALYQRPDILIMDEGTSALDAATEADLVECLRSLEGDVTMVFVAHRLTTIEHCSCIFFLKDGRLQGAGSHQSLLDSVPAYRKMHQVTRSHLESEVSTTA